MDWCFKSEYIQIPLNVGNDIYHFFFSLLLDQWVLAGYLGYIGYHASKELGI